MSTTISKDENELYLTFHPKWTRSPKSAEIIAANELVSQQIGRHANSKHHPPMTTNGMVDSSRKREPGVEIVLSNYKYVWFDLKTIF